MACTGDCWGQAHLWHASRAIQGVTHQREPQGSHVDPDLVWPACQYCYLQHQTHWLGACACNIMTCCLHLHAAQYVRITQYVLLPFLPCQVQADIQEANHHSSDPCCSSLSVPGCTLPSFAWQSAYGRSCQLRLLLLSQHTPRHMYTTPLLTSTNVLSACLCSTL